MALPSPPVRETWKPGTAWQASGRGESDGISKDRRPTTTGPALDDGRGAVGRPGELGVRGELGELGGGDGGDGAGEMGGSGGTESGKEGEETRHGRRQGSISLRAIPGTRQHPSSPTPSMPRRAKPCVALAPDQPLTTHGNPRARVYVACLPWSVPLSHPPSRLTHTQADRAKYAAMAPSPPATTAHVART